MIFKWPKRNHLLLPTSMDTPYNQDSITQMFIAKMLSDSIIIVKNDILIQHIHFLCVCGPLLKSLLNVLQYCFCFFMFPFFFFWLRGMGDLSSRTRDQTAHPLHWKGES